jgi:hypothetical protein
VVRTVSSSRRELLEEFCKHLEATGGGLIDEESIEEVITSFLQTRPGLEGSRKVMRMSWKDPGKAKPRPAWIPPSKRGIQKPSSSNWESFVDDCEDCLSDIGQIASDECASQDGWRDTVEDMQKWAQEKKHVTSGQEQHLERIWEGVRKWLN